jgi:thiamine-monophosphate kinase
LNEKHIIENFFHKHFEDASIVRGIGDDAAVLQARPDHQLVVSTDTMVDGRHFVSQTPAHAIGYKLMAVNISDLAAMGAEPRWATLNLTLPNYDESWCEAFSQGLFECAQQHQVSLMGGDLTSGDTLTLSLQILGEVPNDQALYRHQALCGDDLYVSGRIGDAGAVLKKLMACGFDHSQISDTEMQVLYYPQARINLGCQLRGIAHACIDISDGLLNELEIICAQSRVGAHLNLDQLCSTSALSKIDAITQGDDYELLFTADPAQHNAIMQIATNSDTQIHRIGCMTENHEVVITELGKQVPVPSVSGYDHFKTSIV